MDSTFNYLWNGLSYEILLKFVEIMEKGLTIVLIEYKDVFNDSSTTSSINSNYNCH